MLWLDGLWKVITWPSNQPIRALYLLLELTTFQEDWAGVLSNGPGQGWSRHSSGVLKLLSTQHTVPLVTICLLLLNIWSLTVVMYLIKSSTYDQWLALPRVHSLCPSTSSNVYSLDQTIFLKMIFEISELWECVDTWSGTIENIIKDVNKWSM